MADKLNRRYNILRRVMSEQAQQGGNRHKTAGVTTVTTNLADLMRGPADVCEIGRLWEKHSLTLRLLARHLAQAAAAAANVVC